jgi:hypothetical protein
MAQIDRPGFAGLGIDQDDSYADCQTHQGGEDPGVT